MRAVTSPTVRIIGAQIFWFFYNQTNNNFPKVKTLEISEILFHLLQLFFGNAPGTWDFPWFFPWNSEAFELSIWKCPHKLAFSKFLVYISEFTMEMSPERGKTSIFKDLPTENRISTQKIKICPDLFRIFLLYFSSNFENFSSFDSSNCWRTYCTVLLMW